MYPWLSVVGRLHFLVLHLPIALLLALGLTEAVRALRRRHTHLPDGDRRGGFARRLLPRPGEGDALLVVLAALGAIAATVTGLVHATGEELTGAQLVPFVRHRAGGIVTAVLTVAAAAAFFAPPSSRARRAYGPLLAASCIAVIATGHFGGALARGDGFVLAPLDPTRSPHGAADAVDDDDGPIASDGDEADEIVRERHPEGPVPETPDYTQHIAPLFERSCVKCHGPEKRKSGLRLDKKRFAMKGGESGDAIVPGDPEKSLVIRYVTLPSDDDDVMPPKGKLLSLSETETLRRWISQGAPWPDDAP